MMKSHCWVYSYSMKSGFSYLRRKLWIGFFVFQFVKMGWFSFFSNSKDVESDLTANLLAVDENEETLESMRWKRFTYRELASATQKFKNLIGKGNFGCVYKGLLKSGELVAVKLLKEENQEFNVDALMFNHSNLVTLIGYCTNGNQRFLVSEYMHLGSLQHHLFDLKPKQEPINWDTRMKIAIGVARGLEYLHCKTNPHVIYRNMKASNILLDNDYNPKLSDFGMVEVESNIGYCKTIYGYCAPEYVMTGDWTLKSDIYSFGVVLLELITGRRKAVSLVAWSRPFLEDSNNFIQLLDPLLEGQAPVRWLKSVVALAARCLEKSPGARPSIDEIVVALQYDSVSTLNP